MISSTSTTSTSGVMLISDCRLEPASLLLNCMMSLSFCARALGDQPHPAEALLFDRNHDLPNLAEIELCIAPDHDLGVLLGAHRSAKSFAKMLGCNRLIVDPQPAGLVYGDRIRPHSSPCAFGFDVFGRLTSGPFRICGAITMKMISSTSTTSTSGVMFIAACIRVGSPSRIGRAFLFDLRRLDFIHFDVKPLEPRYFDQTVHELGRSPIHFDMESLNLD